MNLMKIASIPAGLLTMEDAAKLLGISVSTFQRLRKRKGLRPADTVRLKPVLFYETHVRDLMPDVPAPDTSGIITVSQARREAQSRKRKPNGRLV